MWLQGSKTQDGEGNQGAEPKSIVALPGRDWCRYRGEQAETQNLGNVADVRAQIIRHRKNAKFRAHREDLAQIRKPSCQI